MELFHPSTRSIEVIQAIHVNDPAAFQKFPASLEIRYGVAIPKDLIY